MRICDAPLWVIARLVRKILAPVLMLSQFAFGASASNVQAKIEEIRFDNGAGVKFLPIGSSQIPVNADAMRKMIGGQTGDGRYTVFVDVNAITVFPTFENYEFYVRLNSAGANDALTRLTFQATPYDSFPDQNKVVRIHLLEEPQKDQVAELSIPLHSLKAGNSLWAQLSGNAKVHLSGDTVAIDLKNKYLMPVTIVGASVAPVSSSHWTSQPTLKSSTPIVLGYDGNNDHVALAWDVKPRAWGVLLDSLIPFSQGASKEVDANTASSTSDSEQGGDIGEYLEFSIDYVPAQGGFPHTIKVFRRVHFYPSLPALWAVSTLGAVAAGLVMFFGIRKDSGFKKFVKYLWPNIILAWIIEGIAIVLFSFDESKIQIGVVNLNPTLLLPAACLGAASVFYGFQLVEKWLGKAGPLAHAAEPGGANP